MVALWQSVWQAAGWAPRVVSEADVPGKEDVIAALDALPFMGSDQPANASVVDPKAMRARVKS
jgi:hypothetical protein